MSKINERKQFILDDIREKKVVLLDDLAKSIDVSTMTIRRYLKEFEAEKIIKIHNGVALYVDNMYSVNSAAKVHTGPKASIGKMAAKLVVNEDVILIDTGSTCEFVAKNIDSSLDITVICYTINTLLEFYNRNCNIIFGGGYFHKNSLMFECAESTQLITSNRASLAFISASGISIDLGVTCENFYEQQVKIAALKSSLKKVLVADSSKFGKVRATHFADIVDFDVIISDENLDMKYQDYFKANDIEVILAPLS